MAKYHARVCPKCHYYLGFTINRPLLRGKELSIASFCLNCNYEIPVNRIITGKKRFGSSAKTRLQRVTSEIGRSDRNLVSPRSKEQHDAKQGTRQPMSYARTLRSIGQDLENRQLNAFNLECRTNLYLVHVRDEAPEGKLRLRSYVTKAALRAFWKRAAGHLFPSKLKRSAVASPSAAHTYQYSAEDINRLERKGIGLRRQTDGMPDGHSRSQLLRTVGGLVDQRNQRLLGVSWQEGFVGVVIETPRGRREIDIFRSENLYDLWVKMYLKRTNRALSDIPL